MRVKGTGICLRKWCFASAIVSLMAAPPAWPAEFGKIAINDGIDDFLLAAMPPPGTYGVMYLARYTSNYLANNLGNSAVDHFSLTVNAATPRFDWIKPVSVLGADRWGTLILAPYLDVDARISPVPGLNLADSKRGFGDLTIGNGLHWTLGDYQMVNGLDVVFPTGSFDAARLVNLGLNHWTVRLNHLGTWFPRPEWEISYGLRWDYNFENPDTHYTTGQIGYGELTAAWLPTPELRLGVIGVAMRQLTGDAGPGAPSGGNKYSVSAVGFGGNYALPGGVFITAKYLKELEAKNAPRGQLFQISIAFPI
jgi:hypothetical protein